MRTDLKLALVIGMFGILSSQSFRATADESTCPALSAPAVTATQLAAANAEVDKDKAPAVEKKKLTVASLVVKGSLPESAGQAGIFGELEQTLAGLIERLDKATSDKNISAVVLKIHNPTVGRGSLTELRAAIARTRQAGKKVYARVDSGLSADYLLACACDEIIMPESGVLLIPGLRAEVTFYKGLLDKLGIKADMLQVGDFKGAAEPLTRTGMSPEFRQQFDLLIGDFYQQMVETIAADRKLPPKRVEELLDRGLFTPLAAKEAGLIDRVAYADEVQDTLKQQLSADELTVTENYGKRKIDTDFSGMLGMVKLMEMLMGTESSGKTSTNKKVAVVYAVGPITTGKGAASLFGEQVVGSDTVVEALEKAAKDQSVAAIVLRVNSPGGSSLASDLIWREIRRIEKPIVASMGDVAASGGYYISMGCDKIVAEPGTLTGSIGVVGGKLAMEGLYNKVGLSTEVVSRGKNSGLLSATESLSDSQRETLRGLMEEVYRQFVSKAAEGRGLTVDQLKPLAGGRVWTGRQAAERKLVDQVGTLADAVAEAKKLAGISADEKTELLILPKPKSFFDQLLEDPSISSRMDVPAAALPGDVSARLRELQTLQKLFAEPALLLHPWQVDIK